MTDIHDPKPEGLPPHKTLTSYYDADPDRSQYVFDLFNATAQHYDTIERLFGNGGLLYRRLSMRINGLKPGMRALDVATGTGNVAIGAVKIVGPTGQVFCCDPNPGMLREARKKLDVPITRGVAQELPFKSI